MSATSSDMSLLRIIESFNRKERYILFQQVTTSREIQLDEEFRSKLNILGWDVPKRGVLVLTDYHLNWLYASLEWAGATWGPDTEAKPLSSVPSVEVKAGTPGAVETRRALEHNQEDIDLLLVWEGDGITHLGLIEAKAHSGWTNSQMASKAARLTTVLGEDACRYPRVRPHFALLSFTEPQHLITKDWPGWMLDTAGNVPHIALKPPQTDRYMVGRVDSSGTSSASGDYYGVRLAMKGSGSP